MPQMQLIDSAVTILGYIICVGIPTGIIVLAAYFGMKSRFRFAHYLKNLDEAERKQFTYRSSTFITISWSIFALGFAGILLAILLGHNQIAAYLFGGTVLLIITISIIGNLTVYKTPKNKL